MSMYLSNVDLAPTGLEPAEFLDAPPPPLQPPRPPLGDELDAADPVGPEGP
ncbi:MAG: hypothetical protein M3Z03_03290 [Actinomycetota bacterium]|jgi:hypothetical protein|nr:hypothetical protein [Actinomycetota bacterium]